MIEIVKGIFAENGASQYSSKRAAAYITMFASIGLFIFGGTIESDHVRLDYFLSVGQVLLLFSAAAFGFTSFEKIKINNKK